MSKLGAHLSIAGGYTKALERTSEIGGNCLQIFSSSPRSWIKPNPDNDEIKQFKTLKSKLNIDPIYFHSSYLINLADGNQIGNNSKKSLLADMQTAQSLGIKGVVVHLGSYRNQEINEEIPLEIISSSYNILIKNIKDVLEKAPKNILLIIENAGTKKVGQTLDEIAKIIGDVNDDRVRVCFDTCHLHAARYNLSTSETLNQFLNIFNSFIGINKLELWHINDSKDPFGSHRDRHENIGQGHVGTEVFRLLVNHSLTKDLPFIIETPGFNEKGPDKENLDILKSMIETEKEEPIDAPAIPVTT